MSESKVVILILCLAFTTIAQSMRFDMQSGATKCISEDIKSNAMSVGKYSVVNPVEGHSMPDTHKITVRVLSPHGNNYHTGDNVEAGNFAFTAAETGDYMTCFWAPDHKPAIFFSVDFEWKTGVAAKDWSKVAKKGQVDAMEYDLRRLTDTVQSIHDEMFYLREREEEMQRLNLSTSAIMNKLGFGSLCICLMVAAAQYFHLRSFFERKKLL